jgi:F-type H+-transporting ATPase subunit a
LVIFFAIHIYGVMAKGFLKYFKDFASPIFMLPLEIIGQISRTLSLSLRLFGNILSGELIASIVFSLVPLFLPLPLIGLSLLIGVLQAYVFTALASVYISSAIEISEA